MKIWVEKAMVKKMDCKEDGKKAVEAGIKQISVGIQLYEKEGQNERI